MPKDATFIERPQATSSYLNRPLRSLAEAKADQQWAIRQSLTPYPAIRQRDTDRQHSYTHRQRAWRRIALLLASVATIYAIVMVAIL